MNDINNLLPVGSQLRHETYKIERPLGSGGFGNTYLVRHCGLDAMMVVKEFFMKGINLRGTDNTVTVSVPDNRATYESQRDKFKKEAQRLWRLKSDHIVGVHDIFEENGTVYYVMDFIEGESLEDHIRRQDAPMLEHEVRDIMNQLLDALSVIHGNAPTPIFHLDIKPGNILMSKEGRVVLIDFGASKQLSADREGVTSTMITYTRGYAPTEQMDGKPERIGAWTDLYALGATLYKLLTKNVPPDPSEISEETVDAFHFPASVSAQMQKLIMWLMQPNRRKRPQSVAEVRDFLNDSQPGTHTDNTDGETTIIGTKTPEPRTPKPSPESAKEPAAKPESKPWWKYALLALAAVVVSLIAAVLWFSNSYRSPSDETQQSEEVQNLIAIVDSVYELKGTWYEDKKKFLNLTEDKDFGGVKLQTTGGPLQYGDTTIIIKQFSIDSLEVTPKSGINVEYLNSDSTEIVLSFKNKKDFGDEKEVTVTLRGKEKSYMFILPVQTESSKQRVFDDNNKKKGKSIWEKDYSKESKNEKKEKNIREKDYSKELIKDEEDFIDGIQKEQLKEK